MLVFNILFTNQYSILNNGSVIPDISYKIYKRISDFLPDLSKKIKQYNPNKAHIFNSIKMIKIYGDFIIRPLK